jgi:hypothetical protein
VDRGFPEAGGFGGRRSFDRDPLKDAKKSIRRRSGRGEAHNPTDVLAASPPDGEQVIFQKVREAERDHIFSEYGDRIGQLVTGIVKRAESGDLVVDLGKTEALLPRREQSRAEVFNPGERIRVVIVRVSRTSRGPQVIVSRTDPSLLARLLKTGQERGARARRRARSRLSKDRDVTRSAPASHQGRAFKIIRGSGRRSSWSGTTTPEASPSTP